MNNVTRIARELHIASLQKNYQVSGKTMEAAPTDHTSFFSKVDGAALTVADCAINGGIDLDHVFIDNIPITFTRCSYDEKGIQCVDSVLQCNDEASVALQIINDSNLPRLLFKNSVIDGVHIVDQKSDLVLQLENCVFRKSFSVVLAARTACMLTIKNCMFTEKATISLIGPGAFDEFVTVSSDWYSVRYLKKFLHKVTVQ